MLPIPSLKSLKRLLNTVVALVLIGAFVFLFMAYRKARELKKELSNAREIISRQGDTVSHLKDKNGKMFAQVQTTPVTEDNLKRLRDELKAEITTVTGKISRLDNYVRAGYQVTGTATVPITDTVYINPAHQADTLQKISVNDGFLNLDCLLSDSAHCLYTYSDTAKVIVYHLPAGKWWQFWKWGKKVSYTAVQFRNPNAKALEVESIVIKR